MASETAKLVASLTLKDGLTKPLATASKALNGFDAKLSSTQGRAYKAGQQIGTGINNGLKIAAVGVGLLATQVVLGLNSLTKLEGVTTQTAAALRSTGGVSGQTADSIRTLSNRLEGLNATIDDTVIQAGANLLLTFTNIRGKAFEPTLQAALDMNQALGGGPDGLAGVVTILGKALNDPLKGLTALGRKGVTFTADQKAQITAAVKAGDSYKAQGIILAELNKRYAGSFLAGGQTTAGKIAGFTDAIDDLQRALATALLPAVGKVAVALKKFFADPAVIRGVSDLGDKIASLFSDQNLTTGANVLKGLFESVKRVMPAVESAARTIGTVVGAAVDAFKSLPPELQALAVGGLAINKLTGGLVTNIAGGLISAVISSFKGMMNVTAAVVNVAGPVAGGGLPGGVPAAAGGLGVAGLAQVAALAAVPLIPLVAAYFLAGGESGIAARDLAGRQATAAARGLNPANVPTTGGLGTRNTIADWYAQRGSTKMPNAGIPGYRGDPGFARAGADLSNAASQLSDAAHAQVAAAKKLSGPEIKAVISADRTARGIKAGGISTSLAPRLNFLAQNRAGSKDVAVSAAIALGFERGATPLFRDTKQIPRAIKALQRDQSQLLKHGDTKNAGIIGGHIARLKAELSRREQAVKAAVDAKKLSANVSVNMNTSLLVNGRVFQTNVNRFSTSVTARGGNFDMGGV